VHDGDDGLGSHLGQVPPLVDVLVDLADDGDVVAAEDVQAENNLGSML
jgi:hypothetical protein